MLDSSVADQMAHLALRLLEKVRQRDTCVLSTWLEGHSCSCLRRHSAGVSSLLTKDCGFLVVLLCAYTELSRFFWHFPQAGGRHTPTGPSTSRTPRGPPRSLWASVFKGRQRLPLPPRLPHPRVGPTAPRVGPGAGSLEDPPHPVCLSCGGLCGHRLPWRGAPGQAQTVAAQPRAQVVWSGTQR